MNSYVTRLQEIELIAGDGKIVLEFQVFYEDGEPLDLQDDSAKWYLSPIGMQHNPILVKDCTILRDGDAETGYLYYRFTVSLDQSDQKTYMGNMFISLSSLTAKVRNFGEPKDI